MTTSSTYVDECVADSTNLLRCGGVAPGLKVCLHIARNENEVSSLRAPAQRFPQCLAKEFQATAARRAACTHSVYSLNLATSPSLRRRQPRDVLHASRLLDYNKEILMGLSVQSRNPEVLWECRQHIARGLVFAKLFQFRPDREHLSLSCRFQAIQRHTATKRT
ncbi:hypothetical protein RB195_010772 [Necator americanus]|uniref:Uncharacterized protein n=1 Tax=Necator americanus TaxID=51031 RepID=A0ABR1CZG9_NECAM